MAFLASGFATLIEKALFTTLLLTSMASVPVSSLQFEVGGNNGWAKPTGNESETYNEWAIQNRFRIGDTLYFKYNDDSVLEVSYDDYTNCDASNPIVKFDNGETVFEFRRSGLFFFISGRRGHCEAGQKLIVRVLHPSEVVSAAGPAASPAPAPGGDEWDPHNLGPPPRHNSTSKLSVASYFITALGGVLVFLYLLM
ncbi:PREDICTED: early nodulin-like protein 1 [Ipomoea nil]|uniref:early nodulin-like protein 1 n=1 Tax=Ipomoea nil TaxID=35883 RepID=UPI000900AF3E|nr:PREDICTED: early nodulin-like protein 1 [Ipomoea nil]